MIERIARRPAIDLGEQYFEQGIGPEAIAPADGSVEARRRTAFRFRQAGDERGEDIRVLDARAANDGFGHGRAICGEAEVTARDDGARAPNRLKKRPA